MTDLRLAWMYDMDACRGPTGVTRHALAQLERLAGRDHVQLTIVSGRMTEPDGLACWEKWAHLRRRELPLRTRNALRLWRLSSWPPVELWTGPVDWVYCPAEYRIATRRAKLAVTSHDVLQDVRYGSARRLYLLGRIFAGADVILSVSQFNTERLIEAFPACRDKVTYVPNAADDLFFEPATAGERAGVRADLGLPKDMPYLLSVANFQPRKNLARLVRAAGKLTEVASGDLALVLLGEGSDRQAHELRELVGETVASSGKRMMVRLPGYRQSRALRAAYAEATALVFPSLCESFGIPAVEAMAQGVPVVLADSTALPEVGGEAGWYFDPEDEQALANVLREVLDQPDERTRRVALGRTIAERYRWQQSNELLIQALSSGIGDARYGRGQA